jgi:tRNA dimethylallyltransferase
MKKLLVVCGPTATGKTALGIRLAKKFNGEIISADSRQVYKDMDIGTGKEWGEGVKIYGYDLVDPKEDFSISQFLKFAGKTLKEIYKKGKLPILVGGTGFYIKGITDGFPTVDIPRNDSLRERLEQKTVEDLYESLSQTAAVKAGSLNASDRKNPRRLMRAIEVAQYLLDHPLPASKFAAEDHDIFFVGLGSDKQTLFDRIEKRVDERVKMGMKAEIDGLLARGVTWHDQSMFSLGYRQYRDFYEGDVDEEHVVSEWKKEERKYAVRQMVWFKKDKRIRWFDIGEAGYQKKVENMIEKWHNNGNVQKS